MNRPFYALLFAQFLSAFADNAILFVAIAFVMQPPAAAGWYVPALQSAFLIAFVVLAPWAGAFADSRPKPHVLLVGNFFKAIGAITMLAGVEPIVAFALVGGGAAIYGPAKYGILPEMLGHEKLVWANGMVEGSTIFAIIVGTVVGGRLGDWSVTVGLIVVIVCYVLSMGATLLLPRLAPLKAGAAFGLRQFGQKMRALFVTSRARFVMLGASLFWAAAAVLRLLLVAWAPVVLLTKNATDIADLTLSLAIGIVVGAVLAPRFIPIERLRRARLAAYAMGACIVVFSQASDVWTARLLLAATGVCGGFFMVPVNAALQDIGHKSIGSGGAVALQNFFENLAMLAAVGLYTYAASAGVSPIASLIVVGVLVLIATAVVSWRLPPDPNRAPPVSS